MFSCLNTSASVNVLHRQFKTEIEDDFSSMALSVYFTVKLYEKAVYSRSCSHNNYGATLRITPPPPLIACAAGIHTGADVVGIAV
jgi:hypothetical protein